jgi:ATP synthase protein I
MAACSTLVTSVVAFTALGYWLDRKMGHSVPWLLLVGSVVGMVAGFVSFFKKVMGGREPMIKKVAPDGTVRGGRC